MKRWIAGPGDDDDDEDDDDLDRGGGGGNIDPDDDEGGYDDEDDDDEEPLQVRCERRAGAPRRAANAGMRASASRRGEADNASGA